MDLCELMSPTRRIALTAAATVLLSALAPRDVWAGGRPANVEAWLRGVVGLKEELRDGAIDATIWADRVDRLNATVPTQDLIQYFDIDVAARRFGDGTRLANFFDPAIPPSLLGQAGMSGWFFRLFSMRRDGGLLPHVHNNMVSAHLVIGGAIRARTHDRIRDLTDAIVLCPVRDEVLRAGATLAMTDVTENQHWLRGLEDQSITLDVGIHDLQLSPLQTLPADQRHTILVDPDRPEERDGTIIAPVLTVEQSVSKFVS